MALSIGEVVLSRYVVEGRVGVGGMGEVYRASHQTLGMPVAIKVMTGATSPEMVKRFGREAMLLARVRHPNVVSILDVGQTDDGSPCMAMEFLEGEALDARLERRGALPWTEVRAIGLSVLKGLDAVHSAGIVHRDLKPGNVFITRGKPEVVKLVDFWIAYSTAANAAKFTNAGAVIGTPAYMPPEQLVGGNIDARSDLYALGLMLYELLTGRLPFGDDTASALRRLQEPVPLAVAPQGLPAIPEHVSAAVSSALVVAPERRPSSAKAFYVLLRGPRGDSVQFSGPVAPQAAAPSTSRAPLPAAGTRAVGPTAAVKPPPVPPAAYANARTALAWDGSAQASAQALAPAQAPDPVPSRAPHSAAAIRMLVAAKLPVSRMSRDEQKALAQLAAPGRAYHMGGGMWFAVVPAANDKEGRGAVKRLWDALTERYGETCKIVWAPASSGFALTPASLAGASPLPEEISKLLERLL
jgi:hypothetical protein